MRIKNIIRKKRYFVSIFYAKRVRKHRYIMIYTVEKDIAYVVEIHHELEDYRNSIIIE